MCAGSVLLRVGELPNGQDCDNWHQLAIPRTRASRGNLRLVATLKHEVILHSSMPSVRSGDRHVTTAFDDTCSGDSDS